jgi:uncharacterized membrane protein
MTQTNTGTPLKTDADTGRNKIADYVKWAAFILFIVFTILSRLNIPSVSEMFAMLPFAALIVFTWIHGTQRYGLKNMCIWFIITWIVSNGLEGLSIKTGFPFGHYHYTATDLKLLGVPLMIMVIYFGLSYTSWTVAQAVTGHFSKKIAGVYKFIIPLTTSLVMTMWDLATDPQASTINSIWVWENGGDYFGVPVSNFAGWVLVVYIFMQIFTLFIANRNLDISKDHITSKKSYWLEAVIVYLFMGLGVFLEGFTHTEHAVIYTSMAMVSVFTMVFTAAIALLNVKNLKELGKQD